MNRLLLLFLLSFAFLSCTKDREGWIPEARVNYRVTFTEFQINQKNNILLVNNEGVAGIIIYQRPGGGYVAFDRCSSVNPQQRCAVIIDEFSLTATDPCSGAKFFLTDGSPAKAPAVRPLKEYRVTISGNILQVTN